ncbi:MAG: hypothetical protein Q7R31_00875 [Candidatus Levybacteria bacterium]|nr:hypothetical protein [Candidatus Levybacteria bacterium]
MRRIFLLTSFFIITPIFLVFNILYLSFLSYNQNHNGGFISFNSTRSVAFAALPSTENFWIDSVSQKDARIDVVSQFFSLYNSPLTPFASEIIKASDTYGIDYRLLPAIAMQESNLCKKMPPNSYNCWGYGIYGSNVKKFPGFSQAIDAVAKTLAYEYKDQGLKTPKEIVSKYTPTDNGKWEFAVSHFMDYLRLPSNL